MKYAVEKVPSSLGGTLLHISLLGSENEILLENYLEPIGQTEESIKLAVAVLNATYEQSQEEMAKRAQEEAAAMSEIDALLSKFQGVQEMTKEEAEELAKPPEEAPVDEGVIDQLANP